MAEGVAPNQLALTPGGLLVAGLDGVALALGPAGAAPVSWTPPEPLRGTQPAAALSSDRWVTVLAAPTSAGEVCVAPTPQQHTPYGPDHLLRERVQTDGWRAGRARTCRDATSETGWRTYRWSDAGLGLLCRGCAPEHVVGPRAGWIVWRTDSGNSPMYSGYGGARAQRVESFDMDVLLGLPVVANASPVALSPDGSLTLLCRYTDEAPWPRGRSDCGLVPTSELVMNERFASVSSTGTSAARSPALTWTPVAELGPWALGAEEVPLLSGAPAGWPEP